MALVAILSLVPIRSQPGNSVLIRLVAKTPPLLQKLLHIGFYGVLILLLAWTLEGIQPKTYRFLMSWFIAVSFGAVLEWCQTKVQGRFGRLLDVALDAVGATLGLVAAIFLF